MSNQECRAGEVIHIEKIVTAAMIVIDVMIIVDLMTMDVMIKLTLFFSPEVSIRPLHAASKENKNWLKTGIQRCVFLKM